MTDLPELFDLGDRVLLGPRPAAEVAAVIRVTTTLLSRVGDRGPATLRHPEHFHLGGEAFDRVHSASW
ncbi:hypothetical protein [Rhodococcus marinonascens]|uniref:hypothetical protein n=1 Tax=Rhodococcus marinonascens TaxID=38311 RepID=UPI000932B759|nr:hypothetical protein [Rhodococcus marinonascens]